MVPQAAGGHDAVLFVEPNPGKTSATFFTDRSKGELWVGPRLGVRESAYRFQVDAARGLNELPEAVRSSTNSAGGKVRVLRGFDPHVDGWCRRSARMSSWRRFCQRCASSRMASKFGL